MIPIELIERLKDCSIDETSSNKAVGVMLNIEITSNIYSQITGSNHQQKVLTVMSYLKDRIQKPIKKDILNLLIADNSSSIEYVNYLEKKYEVIVHKFKDYNKHTKLDLILFTGGEDVDPGLYGQKIGKHTSINANRDEVETKIYNTFVGAVPFLGICRGNQLLTVLNGCKLIQHVSGHGRDHDIVLNSGLRYKMTSSHHQMIYPFNLRKENYELIAYSEYFKSNTYLNGDNEETELDKDFLEPEIVFYKNTNSLCIQGHPEWSSCEERTAYMCLELIDKYLVKNRINDLVNYQQDSWEEKSNHDYEEKYQETEF